MTRKEQLMKAFADKGMMQLMDSCLSDAEREKVRAAWVRNGDITWFEAVFLVMNNLGVRK